MKPENIPEDIVKQAEVVCAQLLIHTHPEYYPKDLTCLHDWLGYMNNASGQT